MHGKFWRAIGVLIAFSMILAMAAPMALAAGPETSSAAALSKIAPTLRPVAKAGGEALVDVNVFVAAGTNVSKYMETATLRTIVGLTSVVGQVKAKNMLKLASVPGVEAVLDPMPYAPPSPVDPDLATKRDAANEGIRARVEAVKAAGYPGAYQAQPDEVGAAGWWDVGEGHKSAAAWAKGFTGDGVKVAVIDSGVDFAHPDLQGQWAVNNNPDSPYYGWPLAFDQYSMLYYANYYGEYGGLGLRFFGTWYADTSFTITEADPTWSRTGYTYVTPGTSLSGVYHIGWYPDTTLEAWWYQEKVAVLVADENVAGVYDTVYVDLDDDYDFSNEKPVTKDDPISWKDNWDSVADAPGSDGYADISGGMVYWISDGENHPPAYDWLWAPYVDAFAPPANGTVVAFMLNDPRLAGGDHGQLCASAVAGQGVIDGGAPPYKPEGSGGMVQGGGKDAKVIAIGNLYRGGYASDIYYFVALGPDGIPGTGDEAEIASMSFGSSATDNDGWDFESRFQAYLTLAAAPTLSWLASTGNGAMGYGTAAPPSAFTGMGIGASTQYGSSLDFDYIESTDQILYGDVQNWSNRGPGATGSAGVSITANGAWGAGSLALNEWGDGWTAWETWGGTSRSTPIAAGNLALIYDAYMQANGEYPTYDVARELFMSGATDAFHEVFVQGAGVVNADRSTDVAGGLYGLRTSPSFWQAGDYRGADIEGFANIVHPGTSTTKTFTLYNHGTEDVAADISDGYLALMGTVNLEFAINQAEESAPNFARLADYVYDETALVAPGGLYHDSDLMIAKAWFPFEDFSTSDVLTGPLAWDQRFRILAYDWTDINGDGVLWTDTNGNGVVNAGEDQSGEYNRFQYGYDSSPSFGITVREPGKRFHDGFFIGIQRRTNATVNVETVVKVELTFFKRMDWPWLTIQYEDVAPGDMARVRVVHASPDAPAVDVWVDGAVAFENAPFTGITDYASLAAGTYQVQVTPTGATEPVVIDAMLDLAAGTDYTVVAVGELASIEPLVLVDDNSAPAPGKAHVRFVHASPDAPAVDIAVTGGPVLFADVPFKGVGGYLPVDAGTYDLEARVAGTDTVALSVPGVTLEDGGVYTVFAMGLVAGDPPLQAVPSLDADAPMAGILVPAGGMATFDAILDVPADAPLGAYEGVILVSDPGADGFASHTSAIPVTLMVAAGGTAFEFGGVEQETPYGNGVVHGFQDWSWRAESGDWRFFFADIPNQLFAEGTYLVAKTEWGNYPTDIDTLVYGPESDMFSDMAPGVFGPYTLGFKGGSVNTHTGSGRWLFDTATGTTEEWVSAPISTGLHLFMLHNVLFSGATINEAFSGQVGTANLNPAMVIIDGRGNPGAVSVALTSDLEFDDIAATAYGLGDLFEETVPAVQDDPDDVSTATYLYPVAIANGGLLEASTHTATSDVDLFLLYDADGDEVFDFDTEVIASSTTATGNEFVSVRFPADGDYLVAVHGWGVTVGEPVHVMINAVQGNDLGVDNVVKHADGSFTFDVTYDKDFLPGEAYWGLVMIGPAQAPGIFQLPVFAATPPKYEATFTVAADTYINSWLPNANYGSRAELAVRQGGAKSSLLKFDLSSIASDATFESATLSMYYLGYDSGHNDVTAQVHALKRDWVEGEANWLFASAADMWGTPGAGDTATDVEATPFASVVLKPAATTTKVEFDVTGLAQYWIDNMNYGLLLKGVGNVSTEYVFRSSQQPYAPNEQYVPVLEVSYWLESEMPLP